MVAASTIYLTIVFAGFLRDADTSFSAATQLSNNTLASMIVHRRPFTPPRDTLIRVPNIHLMERVLRGLDTLDRKSKNAVWERRKFLADLFNSYSTSIDEYRWLRQQTIRTLRLGVRQGDYPVSGAPEEIRNWLSMQVSPSDVKHADSMNIYRMRLVAPFLILHTAPLIQNDDREALK